MMVKIRRENIALYAEALLERAATGEEQPWTKISRRTLTRCFVSEGAQAGSWKKGCGTSVAGSPGWQHRTLPETCTSFCKNAKRALVHMLEGIWGGRGGTYIVSSWTTPIFKIFEYFFQGFCDDAGLWL